MERLSGITDLIKEFLQNPFAGVSTWESQQAIVMLAVSFLFGLWTAYLSWGIRNRRLKRKMKQFDIEKQDFKSQITNLNEKMLLTKTELETSNSYILEHQNSVSILEEAKASIQAQLNSTQVELLEARNDIEIAKKAALVAEENLKTNVDEAIVKKENVEVVSTIDTTSFELRLMEMEQRINQLEAEKAVLNQEVNSLGSRPHHVSIDDESAILNRRKPKFENPRENEIQNLRAILPTPSSKRKDNLKGISGIGPFLEEQLYEIGIYSYEQISLLSDEMIEKITESIEYIPGRIEKDDWVGQAKRLLRSRKSRTASKSFNLIMGDDLKVIEGIGPKIEDVLKKGRIRDLVDLSNASIDRINKILNDAGGRFKIANPETWPSQAKIAVTGDWDALKKYQDTLQGGRVVS